MDSTDIHGFNNESNNFNVHVVQMTALLECVDISHVLI